MRYLAFVLLISAALVAQAEPALPVEQVGLFPSSELVEQEVTQSTSHLLVLGALKKVNHELQPEKLSSLLELKYGGIHDAVRELGDASEIGKLFAGFQKYLYEKSKVA